jgi:hypothetical protein
MRLRAWLPLLVLPAFFIFGCDDDASNGTGGDVPYVVPNPDGLDHGEPCQSDDECKFELCHVSPNITAGSFGICTKSCGSGGSACNLEGDEFVCARFSASMGESPAEFCVLACASLADCPDGYTDCKVPTGQARKVCIAD